MLDDDLCRELNECADSDPAAIKKLLAKHSMKNKFTPDPTFATSPICITDPDYDFSVDLSFISTVEAGPFYGRENDDAIEHLIKLTELGGLFTTDERIHNFYVTKLVPFSLKGDARAWYDALPCGSLISIFLLICNMLLSKEFITLNSCRMSISLKLWGDFAVC